MISMKEFRRKAQQKETAAVFGMTVSRGGVPEFHMKGNVPLCIAALSRVVSLFEKGFSEMARNADGAPGESP